MDKKKKEKSMQTDFINKAMHDPDFKKQLMVNPKKVLEQELQMEIPENLEIAILEDTPNKLHFVIPCEEEFSDEKLLGIAGGVGKIPVSTAAAITRNLREQKKD